MSCAGGTPVAKCAVALWSSTNLLASISKGKLSDAVIFSLFSSDQFCRSTSPLACGQSGGDVMCVTPYSDRKFSNSGHTNVAALTDFRRLGKPQREKIYQSNLIDSAADVERANATSRKRLK